VHSLLFNELILLFFWSEFKNNFTVLDNQAIFENDQAICLFIGCCILQTNESPGLDRNIHERKEKRIMEIKRNGTQASMPGPPDWFTGNVRIDPLFLAADEPARATGASVTFEPGARTAWHTHPLGQSLIVTAGCGWVQRKGGPIEEIRPGDVIWFPPGEKHWHGASANTAMTHIAIQESLDGSSVAWLEHVSDAQYGS
jgi:quercetin dioxygenase-like cupin family protein